MIATLLMTGILAMPPRTQDAWELKPTFTAGKAQNYKLTIEVSLAGEEHTAKNDFVITPGDAGDNGDRKTKLEWQKIELDGNEIEGPPAWQAVVGKDGVLREVSEPKEDEYRRFLSIFSFAYPDKAVKTGDKWSVEVTPKTAGAKKMKYDFEAKEVEKLGDKEAIKISSKQKEEGDSGITSDGTWWVDRKGTILKYKLAVKNWSVPFANTPPIEATITGEAK